MSLESLESLESESLESESLESESLDSSLESSLSLSSFLSSTFNTSSRLPSTFGNLTPDLLISFFKEAAVLVKAESLPKYCSMYAKTCSLEAGMVMSKKKKRAHRMHVMISCTDKFKLLMRYKQLLMRYKTTVDDIKLRDY